MVTHADLFAGMGAMGIALQGISTAKLYCEVDPVAREYLERNARGAPIIHDVQDRAAFKAHAPVDIVCAGFPCVGFSAVGSKRGLSDKRSALFHAAVQAAATLQADHVFLENVPDILTHSSNMTEILETLSAAGFDRIRWTIVSASDVGAPHLRRRWFCLCSKAGKRIDVSRATPLPGWTRPPCPTSTERDDSLLRMLGNSLVPQAARAALEYLVQDWPRRPCKGKMPKHGQYLGGLLLEMDSPVFPATPVTRITLDPGHYSGHAKSRRRNTKVKSPEVTRPLHRARWPTPRAGPPSHSHVLTERSSWDLCTAARFCSSIDGVAQKPTGAEHRLSAEFATFLMRGDSAAPTADRSPPPTP